MNRGRVRAGQAARDERDRKVRDLDRRGLSIAEIAAALAVSRTTVSRALGRARTR